MHAALTCLTLEHHQALRLNGHSVCPLLIRPFASFASQTLDSGAAALGATLVTNQLRTLSVAFTGAADGACETIALAIALRRPLEDLCLCGNGVGPSGVQALSTALADLERLPKLLAFALSLVACILAYGLIDLQVSSAELHES